LGEPVGIVSWVDDINKFTINALSPMEEYHVKTVEVDEELLIANVRVGSKYAYNKAVGSNDINIRLARDLTAFGINIEDASGRTSLAETASQKELRQVLLISIPEIQRNEIKLEGLARIPRVASKVVVRWSFDKQKAYPASKECVRHLETIRDNMLGESVYFYEWHEVVEELILRCLYPIPREDVEDIRLDRRNKIAMITITKAAASAARRNPINLRLAQEVTGWTIALE
jgi:transcription antitermination factor NusA-like protein